MAPSHHLNQCWNIVNWTIRNKLKWNFNLNSNIFIQRNTFESVVCEMVAISSWSQCVNEWRVPTYTSPTILGYPKQKWLTILTYNSHAIISEIFRNALQYSPNYYQTIPIQLSPNNSHPIVTWKFWIQLHVSADNSQPIFISNAQPIYTCNAQYWPNQIFCFIFSVQIQTYGLFHYSCDNLTPLANCLIHYTSFIQNSLNNTFPFCI